MGLKRAGLVTSVTRFGEISPLWQTFKSLWQLLKDFFNNWQQFELTLTKQIEILGKFSAM